VLIFVEARGGVSALLKTCVRYPGDSSVSRDRQKNIDNRCSQRGPDTKIPELLRLAHPIRPFNPIVIGGGQALLLEIASAFTCKDESLKPMKTLDRD